MKFSVVELVEKDIFSRNIILEGSERDEKARELISVLDSLGEQLN